MQDIAHLAEPHDLAAYHYLREPGVMRAQEALDPFLVGAKAQRTAALHGAHASLHDRRGPRLAYSAVFDVFPRGTLQMRASAFSVFSSLPLSYSQKPLRILSSDETDGAGGAACPFVSVSSRTPSDGDDGGGGTGIRSEGRSCIQPRRVPSSSLPQIRSHKADGGRGGGTSTDGRWIDPRRVPSSFSSKILSGAAVGGGGGGTRIDSGCVDPRRVPRGHYDLPPVLLRERLDNARAFARVGAQPHHFPRVSSGMLPDRHRNW
mmetsp:Transcript_35055/g.87724  ORF Transcript_35055/g.87724 Transcript_35055/m.87724 type:complete len:262 (-) Transcript_35055:233-1018(-)